MKKAILIGIFSSTALAGGPEIILEPDYFNGAYIGGIGGLHKAAIKSSSLVLAPDDITVPTGFDVFVPSVSIMTAGSYATGDKDGYSFGGYGGVQGGLGKVFNHRWYVGAVGFGEWGSQSHTFENDSSIGGGFTIVDTAQVHQRVGILSSSTTVEIQNDYGVAGKIGYLLAPRTMFYAKAGAIWANIKVSNDVFGSSSALVRVTGDDPQVGVNVEGTVAGSSSNTGNKVAALFGGGVEQYIYKDIFSLNIEYDYANFGTVKTGPTHLILNGGGNTTVDGVVVSEVPVTDEVTTATQQAKASAIVSMLMAGLNVHFGSNWL